MAAPSVVVPGQGEEDVLCARTRHRMERELRPHVPNVSRAKGAARHGPRLLTRIRSFKLAYNAAPLRASPPQSWVQRASGTLTSILPSKLDGNASATSGNPTSANHARTWLGSHCAGGGGSSGRRMLNCSFSSFSAPLPPSVMPVRSVDNVCSVSDAHGDTVQI
eukprot:CAMPEP_0176285724 /NCGR_PEP_ID=MMETSP0121_2-20121125/52522_1 /TAXON_ID=160619 /ORGANISM="Kryptoperidinium foliaceum, Strain CCMP 1326" /LENGTH=163 /DNA_ID=CAMNT_0017626227 /DNA_START=113 /DNA_END=601 /DNA_ORIENTATION=+